MRAREPLWWLTKKSFALAVEEQMTKDPADSQSFRDVWMLSQCRSMILQKVKDWENERPWNMGWGYLDTCLCRFWLCRHHEPRSSQRAHPSWLGCAGRCGRSFSLARKQVWSCPFLLLWVSSVLVMLLVSVNLMLEYLLYVHLLDMSGSDNLLIYLSCFALAFCLPHLSLSP